MLAFLCLIKKSIYFSKSFQGCKYISQSFNHAFYSFFHRFDFLFICAFSTSVDRILFRGNEFIVVAFENPSLFNDVHFCRADFLAYFSPHSSANSTRKTNPENQCFSWFNVYWICHSTHLRRRI